jgi:hypothetical protein
MRPACNYVRVAFCVFAASCLVLFTGLSVNDPPPFGYFNWFFSAASTAFVLASAFGRVLYRKAYVKISLILIISLLAWGTVHLILHFLSVENVPIHLSDNGREFIGSFLAVTFVMIATVSGKYYIRHRPYAELGRAEPADLFALDDEEDDGGDGDGDGGGDDILV